MLFGQCNKNSYFDVGAIFFSPYKEKICDYDQKTKTAKDFYILFGYLWVGLRLGKG